MCENFLGVEVVQELRILLEQLVQYPEVVLAFVPVLDKAGIEKLRKKLIGKENGGQT